jgi:hypothetical protein
MLFPAWVVTACLAVHLRAMHRALVLHKLQPGLFGTVLWMGLELVLPHLVYLYHYRALQHNRGTAKKGTRKAVSLQTKPGPNSKADVGSSKCIAALGGQLSNTGKEGKVQQWLAPTSPQDNQGPSTEGPPGGGSTGNPAVPTCTTSITLEWQAANDARAASRTVAASSTQQAGQFHSTGQSQGGSTELVSGVTIPWSELLSGPSSSALPVVYNANTPALQGPVNKRHTYKSRLRQSKV